MGGLDKLAKKYNIKLIDLNVDSYEIFEFHGHKARIAKSVLNADFMINMPVLKIAQIDQSITWLKELKGMYPHGY